MRSVDLPPNTRCEKSGDSLFAATALVHRMTIVMRNVGDVRPTGVAVLNPWES